MRHLTRMALLALALAVPAGAVAQQTRVYQEGRNWVQEFKGSIPTTSMLTVRLPLGQVTVQGGNSSEISYVMHVRVRGNSEAAARHDLQLFRFNASRTGNMAVLDAQVPHGLSDHYVGAELTVNVPRSMEFVKAVTRGGNESVSGIAGRVDLATGGGNIHLNDIGGNIVATSAGGNVDVGSAAGDVTLRTGGGNVRINSVKGRINTATAGGNVTIGSAGGAVVQSGGGEIDVKQCSGQLSAQTAGGSLDLGQVAGRALLQSGGGSIRLLSATGPVVANTGGGAIELYGLSQGAEVQTGAGQITAEFLGANFTGSNLETPAGDIIIYLGPQLKATIEAAIEIANGHRITSDFSEIRVVTEGGQFGPKTSVAEGSVNGGGPVLRLRTANGDIHIKRAKK